MTLSPHFRGFIGPMKGLMLKVIASDLPSWTTTTQLVYNTVKMRLLSSLIDISGVII